jgi:hypothetical protein
MRHPLISCDILFPKVVDLLFHNLQRANDLERKNVAIILRLLEEYHNKNIANMPTNHCKNTMHYLHSSITHQPLYKLTYYIAIMHSPTNNTN